MEHAIAVTELCMVSHDAAVTLYFNVVSVPVFGIEDGYST